MLCADFVQQMNGVGAGARSATWGNIWLSVYGAMTMQPAKNTGRAADKARKLAEYDAWYAEQIQLGLDELDSGLSISNEEVWKRSEDLLAQLEKQHGRKAA